MTTTIPGAVPGQSADPTADTRQTAPAGGARVGTGLGVTASTIKIGIYTANGFDAAAKSAGQSLSTGDQTTAATALVDYLNRHGGMAGRKIVPVLHDMDAAVVAANPESEYQAACSAWTQDDHVYAVASPVAVITSSLYQCLAKAGVVVSSTGEVRDQGFFERYENSFYEPAELNLRRIFTTEADGLSTAGFFGNHPKIGVVIGDTPDEHQAYDLGLKPALARHGLSVADVFAAPVDSSANAAYSNAVLHFATEGITHVLFGYSGSAYLFMTTAETQGYRPKYGLHSRNNPASLLQGTVPAAQQAGAVGVGWEQYNDVDTAHDPGPATLRAKVCLKVMRDAGIDVSNRLTAAFDTWLCDSLFFLKDALAASTSFNLAGFRAGAESLTRYEAASTFQSGFAPGRLHDGAHAYRLFAFKGDCSCYQYISGLRTVS